MSLFHFGKKKEEIPPCCGGQEIKAACSCGSQCGISDIKSDAVEIAKYGVMQTPALVINSKVVSFGKLIKVDEAKKLIEKSGVKA